MKRHLTIRSINIKCNKDFKKDDATGDVYDKQFSFDFKMELVTSGNFEEFWNEGKPNKINHFVLNAILKNMGIDPQNPIYKIDL